MSIITLLTDFGVEDAYVGLMKGVILSANPSAVIVDITHHVDPHDLIQAAYIIRAAYRYFPAGTVHIIVVDPGVGSDRSIVALKMMGQIFLAPDNGTLTLLIDEGEVDEAVRVENAQYFLETVSQTFHGRDIFAPVGAHVSLGTDLKLLGKKITAKDLSRLSIPEPYLAEGNELVGTIVYIDHFGNCITNIDLNRLEEFCRAYTAKRLQIKVGQSKINGVSPSYDSVKPQHPLAVIGSWGYLEIAVNCGSARQYLAAAKGDSVHVMVQE